MERKPNRFWPNFFRIKYIILKLPTISFRAPHPTPPAPDLISFILFLYMNISFYLCSWAERAGRTEKMRQRKDHQLWCKSNTKQNATFTSMDLFSFPWLSSDVFVCFFFIHSVSLFRMNLIRSQILFQIKQTHSNVMAISLFYLKRSCRFSKSLKLWSCHENIEFLWDLL